ncbi:PilX N-terminal domain-containing pilus assembly protein [Planctomycetota bacterium]
MNNSFNDPRTAIPDSRSGIVLLVVLGVLALLSVLAITFVQMTRLERSISRNYVARTRALMAAESGVEYAISRLTNFQGGVIRAHEYQDMLFDAGSGIGTLKYAAKASFQSVDYPSRPVSGVVGSSHITDGDYFILKVEDESGKINLNDSNGRWNIDTDPLPDGGAGDLDDDLAYPRLTMMLETLGEILFDKMTGALIAARLMDARMELPGNRFGSMQEVHDLLVTAGGLDELQFKQLNKHITIYSWQDPNVICPNFTVEISVPDGETQPDDNFGIYMWRDFQNDEYELEPRCPINVNTTTREILQALIQPLQGWYLRQGPANKMTISHYGGWGNIRPVSFRRFYFADDPQDTGEEKLNTAEVAAGGITANLYGVLEKTVPFTAAQAETITTYIYERIHLPDGTNNPFSTWEEFHDFIKSEIPRDDILPSNEELGLDTWPYYPYHTLGNNEQEWYRDYLFEIYTDLLIAMFNPNSDLNDFNPNRNLFRRIDKGQLTRYSTELCFAPTGYFCIESLGLVNGSNQEVLAQSRIRSIVKLFELIRFTTQSQFLQGLTGPGAAGAQTPKEFFSDSENSFLRTHGFEGAGGGIYPGFALQSYPEAYVPDEPERITNSHYDGQLMLSALQFEDESLPILLQDSFVDSLKPQIFGNNPDRTDDTDDIYICTSGSHFCEGYNNPTKNPLTWKRDPEDIHGCLYPDGGFSEAERTIAFPAPNIYYSNDPVGLGHVASVSMWIKPNFHTGLSNRIRMLACLEYDQVWPVRGFLAQSVHAVFYFPHAFNNLEDGGGYWRADTYGINPNGNNYLPHENWLTTRSILFGWGMGCIAFEPVYNLFLVFAQSETPTVSHNFPGHDSSQHGSTHALHNYEDHAWNHYVFCWHLSPETNGQSGQYIFSALNGYDMDPSRSHIFDNSNYQGEMYSLLTMPNGEMNYFRLGEYARMNSSGICQSMFDPSVAVWMENPGRFMADSTFDDVVIFEGAGADNELLLTGYWTDGRYLRDTDNDGTVAVYTSANLTLQDLGLRGKRNSYHIRDVSWTLYWPRNNRSGDAVADNVQGVVINLDDEDDTTLHRDDDGNPDLPTWDPIVVDVYTTADGWSGEDGSGTVQKSVLPTYAGGSQVRNNDTGLSPRISGNEEFRFKLYFMLGDNSDIPLYESPVLDDITFSFTPAKPAILRWQIMAE